MGLIKILVCSVLFASAIPSQEDLVNRSAQEGYVRAVSRHSQVPDSDGWVSIERPDSRMEEFPDEEKGIWIVFSKEIEGEKFHVRFPDDPSYRYHSGGIQLEAIQENDHLQLNVERWSGEGGGSFFAEKIKKIRTLPEAILFKAKKSLDGHRCDLFYNHKGKWVWERIVTSSKLVYTFRTESPEMSGTTHREFAGSLDIFS